MKIKSSLILKIAVFFAGAVLMIFELVGSRVVAPYLGNSTFIWTSLIGIILASLSLGYYFGGRIADKKATLKNLSLIILLSAGGVIFTYLIKDLFLSFSANIFSSYSLQILVVSIVLFSPASFLLGMISPYALKLDLNDLNKSGSTAGNLYALSTLGSIFGTFSAGFFLIPTFGTNEMLIYLALLLIILSFVVSLRAYMSVKIVALALIITSLIWNFSYLQVKDWDNFVDVDSQYSRMWIFDTNYEEERVKILLKDGVSHSAKFLDKDALVFDYIQLYDLAFQLKDKNSQALMLGGAAYTYPQYFLDKYPKASMTVVEIDPKMTKLAEKYFGLDSDRANLEIVHQDARIFLAENKKKYDIIYGDAFSSYYSPPFHLTTIEALKSMKDSLKPDGLAVINIISALQGEKSTFFIKEFATLKKLFSNIVVFYTEDKDSFDKVQNIVLVCSNNKSLGMRSFARLDKRWSDSIYYNLIIKHDGILTDNFAPVEYYNLN